MAANNTSNGRKEVRVRGIGNAKFEELNNVCKYYSTSASAFVKKLIIDYLESCPKHMKSPSALDNE